MAHHIDDFDLAKTMFSVWQRQPHAENDGEEIIDDLHQYSKSYQDAWVEVAREAKKILQAE